MILLRKVYLHPGDLVFTQEPSHLVTVLGSCISATWWHPNTGTSAMCHVMLPRPLGNPERPVATSHKSCRFATVAIPEIAERFRAAGIGRRDVVTRLFGGSVSASTRSNPGPFEVGRKNTEAVRGLLKENGFYLSSEDVGGSGCRRISFRSDTGGIVCEHLPCPQFSPIAPLQLPSRR